MRARFAVPFLLVLVCAASRSGADDMDDRKAVAASKGDLACDLLAKLPQDGNLFFSPESIAVALGMTSLGARGPTLDAFTKVLHVPAALGADRFHAALGARETEDKGFALHTANRLFGQKGFNFRAEFKDTIAKKYGGGLEELDFRAPGARETINGWVSKETKGKIPDLLPSGTPPPDSRLVLVNAVYFKAKWDDEFEERWTKDAPFWVSEKKSVTAKLMHKNEYADYAEDDAFQLVTKGYVGDRFEAVFLLPKTKRADAGAKGLDLARIEKLRAAAKENMKFVSIEVPRFKFEWGQDVLPELRALGLGPACDAKTADFSAMADEPKEPLFLGFVIHKAMVALDEVGTEAAAATASGMRAGGVPPKPIAFRADRPFLFLIRDTKTGAIIFLGRVSEPTAD